MPNIQKLTKRKIRGREFTPLEIKSINKLVKKHFSKGRTYISVEVCKLLGWKQPNGWLKDRACREVLRILHNEQIITLPEPKIKNQQKKPVSTTYASPESQDFLLQQSDENLVFSKIKFQQVKGTKSELIWNKVVDQFHYLGFKTFVGRSLKYLVFYEKKIIAALGFCDPAWKLKPRDIIFKEKGMSEADIRWLGINNGRFLILPWIKIPNLASYILSKIIKVVKKDWEKYYEVKPLYVETFVHSEKFLGTCYKAANWKHIGITKGYKKTGWVHSNSQTPKNIFIYFLNRSNS